MSTKIYNGYKITGLKSFKDVNEFTRSLASEMQELRRREINSLAAKMVFTRFDLRQFGYDENPTENIIQVETNKIIKSAREIDETKRRNPQFDFSCEVSFLSSGSKILALLYSDRESFNKLWTSRPEVSEYHYQDQTDRPDEITRSQWTTRRKDWDKALGNSVAAKNGLSVTFTNNDIWDYPTIREILINQPSFADRVKIISEEKLSRDNFNKFLSNDAEGRDRIMDAYFLFRDWARTEEGRSAYKDIKKDVENKLIRVVTPDLINSKSI